MDGETAATATASAPGTQASSQGRSSAVAGPPFPAVYPYVDPTPPQTRRKGSSGREKEREGARRESVGERELRRMEREREKERKGRERADRKLREKEKRVQAASTPPPPPSSSSSPVEGGGDQTIPVAVPPPAPPASSPRPRDAPAPRVDAVDDTRVAAEMQQQVQREVEEEERQSREAQAEQKPPHSPTGARRVQLHRAHASVSSSSSTGTVRGSRLPAVPPPPPPSLAGEPSTSPPSSPSMRLPSAVSVSPASPPSASASSPAPAGRRESRATVFTAPSPPASAPASTSSESAAAPAPSTSPPAQASPASVPLPPPPPPPPPPAQQPPHKTRASPLRPQRPFTSTLGGAEDPTTPRGPMKPSSRSHPPPNQGPPPGGPYAYPPFEPLPYPPPPPPQAMYHPYEAYRPHPPVPPPGTMYPPPPRIDYEGAAAYAREYPGADAGAGRADAFRYIEGPSPPHPHPPPPHPPHPHAGAEYIPARRMSRSGGRRRSSAASGGGGLNREYYEMEKVRGDNYSESGGEGDGSNSSVFSEEVSWQSHSRESSVPPPPPPHAPASPGAEDKEAGKEDAKDGMEVKKAGTGYPLLASHLTSTPAAAIYRRFETLNHRVLLHMQDEIAELEDVLAKLDAEAISRPASPASRDRDGKDTRSSHHRRYPSTAGDGIRSRRNMVSTPEGEHRLAVLGAIAWKLSQYNAALKSFNDVAALEKAGKDEVEIAREWVRAERPLVDDESRWLEPDFAADLVTLKPPSPLPAPAAEPKSEPQPVQSSAESLSSSPTPRALEERDRERDLRADRGFDSRPDDPVQALLAPYLPHILVSTLGLLLLLLSVCVYLCARTPAPVVVFQPRQEPQHASQPFSEASGEDMDGVDTVCGMVTLLGRALAWAGVLAPVLIQAAGYWREDGVRWNEDQMRTWLLTGCAVLGVVGVALV